MKYIITVFLLLFSLASSADQLSCTHSDIFDMDSIESFTLDSMNAVNASDTRHKVMDLTVTKFGMNQGTGDVSVFTNSKGELTGVKVQFRVDGKLNVLAKDFDELKKGEKLEYFQKSTSPHPALVLKKANGSSISEQTGGKFTVSILSAKPNTYKHYSLFLRKVAGKWVVRSQNSNIYTEMDLTPNVSSLKWTGTFSEATFD